MSGKKCNGCGSSEIEVDPGRGDAVCTACGSVLEDNLIVSEVEFQENAHGGSSAIGQFVSAESKGGATGFGRAFTAGIGQESREITLRKAREGITALCQQLRLNQQCIDIACNFYKMALSKHLTIGRPITHTQAACVYMTCRTEGTPHLLIDVSDAVPICCYQLGRSYFRLSRELCISVPPNDPCLYILRFASQLQFNEKKHEVSMTALRLVQRMKRDSIHSGRRPSGICGAALLIAARLHDFSRTPADVVRIVKVHESTIRKRLMEFGNTPSSALTLEEFMTVNLEEDQDPPAFKAARKRDKERLQKLMEEEDGEKELTELQKEIEAQLEKESNKSGRKAATSSCLDNSINQDERFLEDAEASRFAVEDALNLISVIAKDTLPKSEAVEKNEQLKLEKGLGPDLEIIGLGQPEEKPNKFVKPEPKNQVFKDLSGEELCLSESDEAYISELIMSDAEALHKRKLWEEINAGHLRQQKIKEEMRAREREEGKDKKRKLRGAYKKKTPCNAATAGEAIEKMLAEKKISSKINYDILRTLDHPGTPATPATPASHSVTIPESKPVMTPLASVPASPVPKKRKKKSAPTPTAPCLPLSLPVASPAPPTPATPAPPTPLIDGDDYDDDVEAEVTDAGGELSLAAMLDNGQEDEDYDYEEY